MNRRPPEPLSAEERQLADQLARLGPHGEPSSALDARILAAAHDAVAARPATPRKPRWPVAMGLAASALLAVGIAWQLRPVDEVPSAEQTALPHASLMIGDEPAAADAAAATETAPAATAPQAPAPVAQAPAPAKPLAMPPALAERVATRDAAPPARRQAPASQAAKVAEPASAPADGYERPVTMPPAPPAPPAPAPAAARADATTLDSIAVPSASVQAYGNASGADRPGFVADPETTAAIAARREKARAEQARDAADAAEAARNGAETRVRNLAPSKATVQAAPPPPAITSSAPVAPAPASATRNALKRTDLQLPVIEDTKLPPEDWLERIRLRRDLGDRASATDSLMRFKQNHPFQKVPDDLKELLGE